MPLFLALIVAALLLAPYWGLWAEPADQSSPELFTDVSLQAGITWRHFNGQSRDRFLWVTGGASFLASHDKRVVFGLGKPVKEECNLEIRWPSGTVQTVSGLEINRYHKIAEPAEVPGGEEEADSDGKDRDRSVNR